MLKRQHRCDWLPASLSSVSKINCESYSTIKVYNCKKNLPAMRKDSIIFDRALALDVRAWEATRLAPGRLVRSNHASQEKAVAVIFVVKPATVVYLNSLLNPEKTTVIIRERIIVT